jgi:hypothetical protein
MTKSLVTKALITAVSLGLALAPLAASAGEVNNRIHNENARIDGGVRDGQLTRNEYDHLDYSLDRIEAQRRADLRRDDGHLTFAQREQLNREESNLSRNIYFDNHDRARQWGPRY